VKITIEKPLEGGKPEISLNWGSGGIVSGLSNKELAHSMTTVWAWVQDYLSKHE
jgi:hypothetical protein